MSDKNEKTPEKEQELNYKEAYFASLAEWANKAYVAQAAMAGFPDYLRANYPQLFRAQNTDRRPGNMRQSHARHVQRRDEPVRRHHVRRRLNRAEQQSLIERRGGYEFVLAPLWKRIAAQIIDMHILLMLKIIITYLLVLQFPSLEKELIWHVMEDDLVMYYFGITTSIDYIVVRTFLKLAGFCYEPLWTRYCNGVTPGKFMIGLRIWSTRAVLPLQPVAGPNRVLIYSPRKFTMRLAIIRSLIKRFVTTVVLPMSIRIVFYQQRANYDLWTETVVVEEKRNPVFRPGTNGRNAA